MVRRGRRKGRREGVLSTKVLFLGAGGSVGGLAVEGAVVVGSDMVAELWRIESGGAAMGICGFEGSLCGSDLVR